MEQTKSYHFEDFTEARYRELLAAAKKRYAFEGYTTALTQSEPHVLWRHDVDFSVHRALRLAELEAEAGVCATYFFLPHCEFYNLLEKLVFQSAQKILSLGHHLGLHFDADFYEPLGSLDALEEKLGFERNLLETLFAKPVEAFSFHNPTLLKLPQSRERDFFAGMLNAYGPTLTARYFYCSDSNGYWRHRRMTDVLVQGTEPRLHLLTHPAWWVPEPMAPRDRIQRCIDGRASAVGRNYDELLAAGQRENVGKSI